MEIEKLIAALRCSEAPDEPDNMGCANKKCKYRDVDGACDIASMCYDSAEALALLTADNVHLRAENHTIRENSVSHAVYQAVVAERDAAMACINGVEEALRFQMASAAMLRISEWRGTEGQRDTSPEA